MAALPAGRLCRSPISQITISGWSTNLNIPLYLVAPDERRQKVFAEVNRPTFSRLSPPLVDLCRFIAFSALRDQLGQVRSFVRYLKPEFLDEVSESCVLEDD